MDTPKRHHAFKQSQARRADYNPLDVAGGVQSANYGDYDPLEGRR